MHLCVVNETMDEENYEIVWEIQGADNMAEHQILKLDPDVGRTFKSMCAMKGITMRDQAQELILLWIAEHTQPTGYAYRPPETGTAPEAETGPKR